jgi:SAM-dependent methyltransferase
MHRLITSIFFKFYFTSIIRPFAKFFLVIVALILEGKEEKIDNDKTQIGSKPNKSYIEEHIEFTKERLKNYPHDFNLFNLLFFIRINHLRFTKNNNFYQKKILSLGPRNILELLIIYLCGFKWENIQGLDIISKHKKIKIGDFSKRFPFEDNSFDYVLCSHSISKSADQKSTEKEIKRILKDGGYLAISDNNTKENEFYVCNGFENQYQTILNNYGNSKWQNLEYQRKVDKNTFEAIVKIEKN